MSVRIRGVPAESVIAVGKKLGLDVGVYEYEVDEVGWLKIKWVEPTGEAWLVLVDNTNRLRDEEDKPLVCIHGQAALIEQVLRRHPDAKIKTELAVYRGLDDFIARQPRIFRRLTRTMMKHEFCTCDREARRRKEARLQHA